MILAEQKVAFLKHKHLIWLGIFGKREKLFPLRIILSRKCASNRNFSTTFLGQPCDSAHRRTFSFLKQTWITDEFETRCSECEFNQAAAAIWPSGRRSQFLTATLPTLHPTRPGTACCLVSYACQSNSSLYWFSIKGETSCVLAETRRLLTQTTPTLLQKQRVNHGLNF